jgi:hypothetical protein
MSDTSVLLVVICLAAALVSGALAVEIYRRAVPQAETTVLLITLAILCATSLLLATDIATHDIAHVLGPRAHFIILSSLYFLHVSFFATGAHFLYLSVRRNYPYSNDPRYRRLSGAVCYVSCYGAAVVVLGAHVYFTVRELLTKPAGNLVSMHLRGLAAAEITGCGIGSLLGYWMVAQFCVLALLYRALPEGDRRSKIARSWFSERRYEWGYGRPNLFNPHAGVSPGVIKDEFRAFVITFLGAVGMFALTWASLIGGWSDRPRIGIGETFNDISPLLVLAPLVYYKSRFVFFDVLIKRGAIALLLLASAAVYFPLALGPMQRTAGKTTGFPEPIVIALAGALFVGLWSAVYSRVERGIDRFLFRRPNYANLLREIASGLKRFVEPGAMIEYAAERLKDGIPAETVDYVEPSGRLSMEPEVRVEPGPTQGPSEAATNCRIQLAVDRQNYGWLRLGPRPHSHPYQSEDIGFLETVATHLSGMLRNLDLRLERDRQENREAELRELARSAELKALKAQINPHFLFNALNSLADMAGDDPVAAEQAIVNLASVFRFTLEAADKESVSLGEEADFIRAYLEIERIRFEDRLDYELTIPVQLKPVRIPPMLLQPLVENAVKHGISPLLGKGGKIVIRVAPNGADVQVTVHDNGVGFDPAQKTSGIGLSNVRRRVQSIFGGESWSLISVPGTGTTVGISFPTNIPSEGRPSGTTLPLETSDLAIADG